MAASSGRQRVSAFSVTTKMASLLGRPRKRTRTSLGPYTLGTGKRLGINFDGLIPNTALRNASVANRASLIIDPSPRSLSGPNKVAHFDTGTFLGGVVPLGEIRTETQGRLLVLGPINHKFCRKHVNTKLLYVGRPLGCSGCCAFRALGRFCWHRGVMTDLAPPKRSSNR